jgi:hypothetical protein
VQTDRGTEHCGHPQSHEFALYRAVENIDHTTLPDGAVDQNIDSGFADSA